MQIVFLRHHIRQLQILNNGPFFSPTLYIQFDVKDSSNSIYDYLSWLSWVGHLICITKYLLFTVVIITNKYDQNAMELNINFKST